MPLYYRVVECRPYIMLTVQIKKAMVFPTAHQEYYGFKLIYQYSRSPEANLPAQMSMTSLFGCTIDSS